MKKQNPALIYGLIGAAILILFGFGMQMYFTSMMEKAVANGDTINPMKFLVTFIITILVLLIVLIICIVATIKNYRKTNPDYTYKKLAGQGLMATLIISLVSTGFSLLYSQVLDPGATQKSKDLSIQVIENMNMPDDQKEKQLDRIRNQKPVGQAITGTAVTLFCGLIISLIAASVLNKKGKEFPENPHNLS